MRSQRRHESAPRPQGPWDDSELRRGRARAAARGRQRDAGWLTAGPLALGARAEHLDEALEVSGLGADVPLHLLAPPWVRSRRLESLDRKKLVAFVEVAAYAGAYMSDEVLDFLTQMLHEWKEGPGRRLWNDHEVRRRMRQTAAQMTKSTRTRRSP